MAREEIIQKKRKILIIEDNEMNREILSALLEDEFDIMTAENGQEGYELLSKHYRELSLILLDVIMPVCNGFEFLRMVQGDVLLESVPIIVTTGSNRSEDEVKCLDLGASDFITKPYNSRVVLGRIHSIIKLRESVATLSIVEYDDVTGFYTMPAFHHHADLVLKSDPNSPYCIFSTDIPEFKLVNSSYGEKKGDEVLQFIARQLAAYLPDALFARQGDKFFCLVSMKEKENRELLTVDKLSEFSEGVIKNCPIPNIIIKYGIYLEIDRTLPISIVCDRAVMATASVKREISNNIAFYDDSISERQIRNQQMEARFETAIRDEEFVIYYQPKIDINTEKMVAAEALVRWRNKDGKMISPGEFIPLFEQDGLVHRLDEYVFQKVCDFIKNRIERGEYVVPISVNLSRNTVYFNGTVRYYKRAIETAGIPKDLIPIELTESAAIEGNRIICVAEGLVGEGFSLHMDDFGAGYSSLSSLSVIPFDVIKLDKSLIDQIGSDKGDIILRYTIQIAQKLGMKVVAEGVEKQEQIHFLKETGCDMIQGYYYSAPKDQASFEKALEEDSKK